MRERDLVFNDLLEMDGEKIYVCIIFKTFWQGVYTIDTSKKWLKRDQDGLIIKFSNIDNDFIFYKCLPITEQFEKSDLRKGMWLIFRNGSGFYEIAHGLNSDKLMLSKNPPYQLDSYNEDLTSKINEEYDISLIRYDNYVYFTKNYKSNVVAKLI
jgi:hypothetical protein